jgi:hypothetical protein
MSWQKRGLGRFLLTFVAGCAAVSAARAQDKGQADLDKATQLKIAAENLNSFR